MGSASQPSTSVIAAQWRTARGPTRPIVSLSDPVRERSLSTYSTPGRSAIGCRTGPRPTATTRCPACARRATAQLPTSPLAPVTRTVKLRDACVPTGGSVAGFQRPTDELVQDPRTHVLVPLAPV